MGRNNNHVVIMAGGIGSRFWPMSTTELPKQFVDILGVGKTLIQMTVDRFMPVCPIENLWVVTGASYAPIVREQIPDMLEDHVLLEPVGRGTAPCIAYACWKIALNDPSANIVFTPADALVLDTEDFRRVILKALDFTCSGEKIVTVGIRPSRPETGYGYIAAGAEVLPGIRKVDSFREKPDRKTAEYYISQPDYLWNAGIFVWGVQTIVSKLRTYVPDIAAVMDRMAESFDTPSEKEQVFRLFPTCEKISIDYAVMEKADCIYTLEADFGWSDLGTWGSLKSLLGSDAGGNAVAMREEDEKGFVRTGETIASEGDGYVRMYDCNDCIVHVPDTEKVVLQGLDGYIVAAHGDRLLVCRLDHEQEITGYIKI